MTKLRRLLLFLWVVLAVAFAVAPCALAQSDGWKELARLTAHALRNSLGSSVAISNDKSTVVAGADSQSVTQRSQGAAFIFTKPTTWHNVPPTTELFASDGKRSDYFGVSVAISGDTVVVGAQQPTGFDALYVFVKPSTGWPKQMTQTAKLIASDETENGQLGFSVSISGDTIVSAAANPGGNAYVFVKPASGWVDATETAKLSSPDGRPLIAAAISPDGSTIVAGVEPPYAGAAFVYRKPAKGWVNSTSSATLTSSDGVVGDWFGSALSVVGNTIVVGAMEAHLQGAAYVFVKPANGWTDMTQTAELTASDGAPSDFFGISVSMSDKTIVVGAPDAHSGQGAVYTFVEPLGGWQDGGQTSEISGTNQLGRSVVVNGSRIVAGAPAFITTQHPAAYVFGR